MTKRFFLFILVVFFALILRGQENDSIACTTPSWPFFGLSAKEDPESYGLKHLVAVYYHDDNDVYFEYKRDVGSSRSMIVTSYHKIEGAEIEGFEAFKGSWYAKDRHSVFYRGFNIQHADPDTFEPLNLSYAKDKNNIYFKACKIEEVDRNTFRAIDNGGYYDFAYDKNLLYFYKERIPIDSATFSVDKEGKGFSNVSRDKNNLYYLSGTSFDGYITIKHKTDSMIINMFTREGIGLREWSVRPYEVKIKAKDVETEKELQEKILMDFKSSIKINYITFTDDAYRLKDLKLTFAFENHRTVYDVEPWGGNYLLLTQDATERYKAMYPDSGITQVLLVLGLHTD